MEGVREIKPGYLSREMVPGGISPDGGTLFIGDGGSAFIEGIRD